MILTFPATITSIFERKLTKHLGGSGPEARFGTSSAGWYIQIDGAISIWVGDKPEFSVDDEILISIRKR